MRYSVGYGPLRLGIFALFGAALSFVGFWDYFTYRDFTVDDLVELRIRIGSTQLQSKSQEWSVRSPDVCGELIIRSLLFNSLRAAKGSCGLKPGDTATITIETQDLARLKQCKWADMWTIRVRGDTILGLSDTNAALRKNSRIWAPILGFASLFGTVCLSLISIKSLRGRAGKANASRRSGSGQIEDDSRGYLPEDEALTLPVIRKMPLSLILTFTVLLTGGFVYVGISRIVMYLHSGPTNALIEGIALLCGSSLVPVFLCRYRLTITDEYVEIVAFRTSRIRFSDVREVHVVLSKETASVRLVAPDKELRIPGPGVLPDRDAIIQTIAKQLAPHSSVQYTGDADTIRILFGKKTNYQRPEDVA